MFKKTLISLAVASTLGLTGCWDDGGPTNKNANPNYKIVDTSIDASVVRPIFDPNPLSPTLAVPPHFDLLLLLGATQSADYDFTGLSSGTSPADDAINRLSGFSTTGAFNIPFNGELDPSTVIKGATVHLIALNVAPTIASAPDALPAINPTQIIQADPVSPNQPNYRVEVISLDGGTNNAIRVVPLEPLAEGQKYLVLVGSGVQGANGKNIDRSVQAANLADGTLGNPALANVKSLLQGLNTLGNGILASSGQSAALAYTFTTNQDTDVLRAMTSPFAYLPALGQKIGFTAQLKAVRDNYPGLNFSQLTPKLQELGGKAAALAAGELDPSTLTAQELMAITALGNVQTTLFGEPDADGDLPTPSPLQIAIGSEVSKGNMHLPQPRPSFFFSPDPAVDLATIAGLAPADPQNTPISEWNPIYAAATQVRVSQGAITLPYYQSLPGAEGRGIVDGHWIGSTSLETSLNDALVGEGNTIFRFLRDIDGALNVNGNFPFPQQKGNVTVPVVVYHPATGPARPDTCVDANSPNGVTIFQHGITVDRSVSMLPGILIANQACQAVVAIDQPLHGLAGATTGRVAGLTELDAESLIEDVEAVITLLSQDPVGNARAIGALTSLINADYIGERHFNFTADAALNPVAAATANVSSGSLFINPLNMLNSRDNVRQSIVDLLNVSASVGTFTIDGTSGAFADVPVHFVGHSLGGIAGTGFAALSNNGDLRAAYPVEPQPFFPQLDTVVLRDTSGQVTRLIENSPAFSGQILGGLAAQGVTQGSSDFENFFYIFQSVVDAGDPVSFAKDLGSSTTNILISEVIGDNTVPNEANINPLGSALSAPLAGTEPLMALIDLGAGGTALSSSGDELNLVTSSSLVNEGALPAASFFAGANPCTQANHGTFVGPIVPNAACPGSVANTSAAFAEMVRQTVLAILGLPVLQVTGATPADQPNLTVLGTSDTVENALDQDKVVQQLP
ncbi:MAG: MECDP-synthase [Marinobacter sp.]|nr:MECDP-synthase [Marinobacter sp.]